MFVAVMSLLVGLVMLVVGAELLVRGASRLAAAARIPRMIVGLTVVAYGTSAPEFAVSIGSAVSGNADLALGNVLGSNIFNVLFILGLSALVTPLLVSARLVRFDVPLLVVVTAGAWVLADDGLVSRWDGLLLLAGVVVYTGFLAWQARRASASEAAPEEGGEAALRPGSLWVYAAIVVVGLVLLVFGARAMVDGASTLALRIGLSELVVGLTVVAIGTSLPEVAASVVAVLRGERDIAVGNVIGSNLVNLLGVLGASAALSPSGVAAARGATSFDFPVALAVAVACLPIFFTGGRIARWEGAVLFGFYLGYLAYVLMQAVEHPFVGAFGDAMAYFLLPLAGLTLLVVVTREWRTRT